jgi:hypothetical protein
MNTVRGASAALAAVMLISLCAMAAPAPFSQREHLQWRFVAGKPFYQKMVTETAQTMKISGNDVVQKQTQTLLYRWVPVRQLPNGNWVVKQKLQRVQFDIEVGGSKITYDSAAGAAQNPLAAFFQAWLNMELTLTINSRMKVIKVEGRDALLQKLAKEGAGKGLADVLLSERNLKETARSLFGPLPGRSVKKGARWDEKTNVDWGGMGNWSILSRYTFAGRDSSNNNLARIAVTQKLQYTGKSGASLALPYKVVSSDFKKSEGTGTLWVNLSKARTERAQTTMRLSGRMTLEIGGTNTDVEIDQTQKTTITTLDAPPGAEKKGQGR